MLRSLFARSLLTLGILLGTLGTLVPVSVYAAATDPFGGLQCSGQASNSSVCAGKSNTGDPVTGKDGALVKATNVLALIAGLMAVIFLVLGGIKYITSGGAPAEVSKAKESIIYAVVGIVVIVIARQLIGFVLSKV